MYQVGTWYLCILRYTRNTIRYILNAGGRVWGNVFRLISEPFLKPTRKISSLLWRAVTDSHSGTNRTLLILERRWFVFRLFHIKENQLYYPF
jgi:hypothetical protein